MSDMKKWIGVINEASDRFQTDYGSERDWRSGPGEEPGSVRSPSSDERDYGPGNSYTITLNGREVGRLPGIPGRSESVTKDEYRKYLRYFADKGKWDVLVSGQKPTHKMISTLISQALSSEHLAEDSKEKDPVWNKGTPMPKDYTCHCGLYVHPSRRNPKAIHISDCPYAPKQDKEQGVAEGRFDEPLTGWHIVSKAHGQVVRGTPSFETKEQAQKYLMTKMFANHQDYEVVHTGGVTEGYKNTFSNEPQQGVAEVSEPQMHGNTTDLDWYEAYKDNPIRVRVKNTSGIGGAPSGTFNVKSFEKISSSEADFTIVAQGEKLTATEDLDNPRTYVDRNYDRKRLYSFYSGQMPITARQAFNLMQVKKQRVAEGKIKSEVDANRAMAQSKFKVVATCSKPDNKTRFERTLEIAAKDAAHAKVEAKKQCSSKGYTVHSVHVNESRQATGLVDTEQLVEDQTADTLYKEFLGSEFNNNSNSYLDTFRAIGKFLTSKGVTGPALKKLLRKMQMKISPEYSESMETDAKDKVTEEWSVLYDAEHAKNLRARVRMQEGATEETVREWFTRTFQPLVIQELRKNDALEENPLAALGAVAGRVGAGAARLAATGAKSGVNAIATQALDAIEKATAKDQRTAGSVPGAQQAISAASKTPLRPGELKIKTVPGGGGGVAVGPSGEAIPFKRITTAEEQERGVRSDSQGMENVLDAAHKMLDGDYRYDRQVQVLRDLAEKKNLDYYDVLKAWVRDEDGFAKAIKSIDSQDSQPA